MARSGTQAAKLVARLLNNANGATGDAVTKLATQSTNTVVLKTIDGDTITLTAVVS